MPRFWTYLRRRRSSMGGKGFSSGPSMSPPRFPRRNRADSPWRMWRTSHASTAISPLPGTLSSVCGASPTMEYGAYPSPRLFDPSPSRAKRCGRKSSSHRCFIPLKKPDAAAMPDTSVFIQRRLHVRPKSRHYCMPYRAATIGKILSGLFAKPLSGGMRHG